MISVIRIYSAA